MAIRDLFSKRKKRLTKQVPDVYQYDNISPQLRVQIIYIVERLTHNFEFVYVDVNKILMEEYGFFRLVPPKSPRPHYLDRSNDQDTFYEFLMLETTADDWVLDAVELIFREVMALSRQFSDLSARISAGANELNTRFQEHGLGYQFESGQLIRIDSQIMHKEAVKPALYLLSTPGFEVPNEEFRKAHEFYRQGNYEECLLNCCKAFESTMKVICDKKGWRYKGKDTCKKLIQVLLDNGLVPNWLQEHLNGLRITLESGVPTVRNKLGGHGAGSNTQSVPEYMASYAIHLTASNILLLVEAAEEA